MTTTPRTLRIATAADAPALAAFAERTFRETFGAYNDPGDMDAYCREACSVEQTRRHLVDPAHFTLLLEQAGQLAGYAQLLRTDVPACITGPAPIELLRFYIDKPWQGLGLAQTLMRDTITAARRLGAETIYLGVWEHNARAIAFYEKSGFRAAGSRQFVLGKKVDNDLLFVRAVDR